MKQPPKNEMELLQEQILARQVEEELQKERLNNFFKKYGTLITCVVVGIILFVSGTQVYDAWVKKVRLAESNQFESAVLSAFTGDEKTAVTDFEALIDSSRTGYKSLSQMRLADIYFKQNQPQKALDVLQELAQDEKASQSLRAVAVLTPVAYKMDLDANYTELELELAPLLTQKNAFYASAVELQTMLLLLQNKKEDAILLLTDALNQDALKTNESRKRLNDLLSTLEK